MTLGRRPIRTSYPSRLLGRRNVEQHRDPKCPEPTLPSPPSLTANGRSRRTRTTLSGPPISIPDITGWKWKNFDLNPDRPEHEDQVRAYYTQQVELVRRHLAQYDPVPLAGA